MMKATQCLIRMEWFLLLIGISSGLWMQQVQATWGGYRAGVYIGARAAHASSPLVGLMWTNALRLDAADHIRHDCDIRDEMTQMGANYVQVPWYMSQSLDDPRSGLRLDSVLLADNSSLLLRLNGSASSLKETTSDQDPLISLFWYVSLANESHSLRNSGESLTQWAMSLDPELGGDYQIEVRNDVPRACYGMKLSPSRAFDVKSHVRNALIDKMRREFMDRLRAKGEGATTDAVAAEWNADPPVITLPNRVADDATFIVCHHVVDPNFAIDLVIYGNQNVNEAKSSGESDDVFDMDDDLEFKEHAIQPSGLALLNDSQILEQFRVRSHAIQARLDQAFPHATTDADRKLVRRACSDLLAGVSFLSGGWQWQQKSRVEHNEKQSIHWAHRTDLLTHVPSRTFFPRGFLWDEGFHLALTGHIDRDLALSILNSWLSLIQHDGWIPREVLFGEEARSRVPDNFQVQSRDVANPPTILWQVAHWLRMDQFQQTISASIEFDGSSSESVELSPTAQRLVDILGNQYERIRLHVEWFLKTQRGSNQFPNTFRWRGRSQEHCLSSGLDDYPRATRVDENDREGHVDLQSWIVVLLAAMRDIAHATAHYDDEKHFENSRVLALHSLKEMYWSEEDHMFADWIWDEETSRIRYVVHKGYVSLFPFLHQLVDADSQHLSYILDLISDENHIWTQFGISSLSKQDAAYGTKENYWRSPIWYNVNHLIVEALAYYGQQAGPFQARIIDLHQKLRRNLIENIGGELSRTGYLWEQYNPITGKGQRSRPFTGWTSLVALLFAK